MLSIVLYAMTRTITRPLGDLATQGLLDPSFSLRSHQEAALAAVCRDKKHLVVTAGTGSGKTEAFLLPLLSSLLHPDRWLLVLGILFVLSVYFFPTGIVGKLRQRRA